MKLGDSLFKHFTMGKIALSILHMDSDMEEDFADEITILTKAIEKAEKQL